MATEAQRKARNAWNKRNAAKNADRVQNEALLQTYLQNDKGRNPHYILC